MSRYSREELERARNPLSKHTALGRALIIQQLLTDQGRLINGLQMALDLIPPHKQSIVAKERELLEEILG